VSQLKKLLLVLTPMGAAAFVGGGGTFGSFSELAGWMPRRPPRPAVASPKHSGLYSTKRALAALTLVGAAAYFGFSGAFANFSAETSNNNSSIASGTLTMNNTANGNPTTCFSGSAASADNVNANCDAAFNITNVAPGVPTTNTAKIVVKNAGSIDGSKLYVYASLPNGKLATPLTATVSSGPTLTLAAPGLEGTIATGNNVVVSYGGHSQTFVANGATAGGTTSVAITAQPAAFNFPAGSTVTNTSGNAPSAPTDCYDVKTTAGGALNFNSPTGNPFCQALVMWVQEVGTYDYCWVGKGSPNDGGSEHLDGLCIAPFSATLPAAGLSGTVTSIPLAAPLNGNVSAGDQITVTQGTHTQTFTAAVSTSETYGAMSITITSTPVGTAFTSGAVVTNSSAQTQLTPAATNDTVSSFDTLHSTGGRIELTPPTGNGLTTAAAVELANGASRTLYVGLYLPAPNPVNQNAIQGLVSTFGLTWHMDQ